MLGPRQGRAERGRQIGAGADLNNFDTGFLSYFHCKLFRRLYFKENDFVICYFVRYIFDDHYFQNPMLRNNPFQSKLKPKQLMKQRVQ